MIRMRNEATANSQLQASERGNQSDICGDEERKKFPGQKKSKQTGLKERGPKRKLGRSLLGKDNSISSLPLTLYPSLQQRI